MNRGTPSHHHAKAPASNAPPVPTKTSPPTPPSLEPILMRAEEEALQMEEYLEEMKNEISYFDSEKYDYEDQDLKEIYAENIKSTLANLEGLKRQMEGELNHMRLIRNHLASIVNDIKSTGFVFELDSII